MSDHYLRILQVSTRDIAGGAEKIAWDLSTAYRKANHEAWLAVGTKLTMDPDVFSIPKTSSNFFRVLFEPLIHVRGVEFAFNIMDTLITPQRIIAAVRGYENFYYPGTWKILSLSPQPPDIIHAHNLHGGYFDLRALPWLSTQAPTVLTLHDAWLLSGHCAHSFSCERWKTGCGLCPDLSIYPATWRDATAYNWQKKAEIYKNSQYCIVTPCQWLMDKVNQSILKPGIVAQKVIPNGVNQSIFHPANKMDARTALNLPPTARILLFAANGIRNNIFKDYNTLISALTHLSSTEVNVLCLALGEVSPSEHIGKIEIKFVPFQPNPQMVAQYFQAADVYIHPARAEVWGLTITEALSCGTPVVASAVGGIPEQIQEGKTGFLVPEGNAEAMAERILLLLNNDEFRQQMGQQAAIDAAQRFGLERMAGDYLALYQKLLEP